MKVCKRSGLAILVLLMLFSALTVNMANAVEAEIVSEVMGLKYYVPCSNSFTHGDTLKVYTEMCGVNHDGFVFVAFFYVIEDPRGHVVSMDSMEVNFRGYDSNAYVEYTETIPSWWLYGRYKLKIYAYNRLDKAEINELERDVEHSGTLEKMFDVSDKKSKSDTKFGEMEDLFENACGGDGGDLEDLSVIKPISDSVREIKYLKFFVRSEEEILEAVPPEGEITGATDFTVTGVGIDKFSVKPDEPVTISLTVKNEGMRGTEEIALVINGEEEAAESVTLDYQESETLYFTVRRSQIGQYQVTIPGTDIVKQFFVVGISGEEETTNSGISAAAMVPPRGTCLPINVFGIALVAITIFVLVMIPLRLRSKQLSAARQAEIS